VFQDAGHEDGDMAMTHRRKRLAGGGRESSGQPERVVQDERKAGHVSRAPMTFEAGPVPADRPAGERSLHCCHRGFGGRVALFGLGRKRHQCRAWPNSTARPPGRRTGAGASYAVSCVSTAIVRPGSTMNCAVSRRGHAARVQKPVAGFKGYTSAAGDTCYCRCGIGRVRLASLESLCVGCAQPWPSRRFAA
jgi:hypothetical protein